MSIIVIKNTIQQFFLFAWIFLMIFGFFGGIFMMAKIDKTMASGIALFLATILTSSLSILFHFVDIVSFKSNSQDANGGNVCEHCQHPNNDNDEPQI